MKVSASSLPSAPLFLAADRIRIGFFSSPLNLFWLMRGNGGPPPTAPSYSILNKGKCGRRGDGPLFFPSCQVCFFGERSPSRLLSTNLHLLPQVAFRSSRRMWLETIKIFFQQKRAFHPKPKFWLKMLILFEFSHQKTRIQKRYFVLKVVFD